MSTFNISNYTLEDQERMAALLERDKRWKDKSKVYMARNTILLQKAKAQGITVSEKEIDEYLKTHKK